MTGRRTWTLSLPWRPPGTLKPSWPRVVASAIGTTCWRTADTLWKNIPQTIGKWKFSKITWWKGSIHISRDIAYNYFHSDVDVKDITNPQFVISLDSQLTDLEQSCLLRRFPGGSWNQQIPIFVQKISGDSRYKIYFWSTEMEIFRECTFSVKDGSKKSQ